MHEYNNEDISHHARTAERWLEVFESTGDQQYLLLSLVHSNLAVAIAAVQRTGEK